MEALRKLLEKPARHFEPGGKFERLYPLWEANDTFLFTPGKTTRGPVHVRDGVDLKRLMIMVVVALVPAILMAIYNTGYQANYAIAELGAQPLDRWQTALYRGLGFAFDPTSWFACAVHGALYFVPLLVVGFVVVGGVEVLFSIVRRHEVNEGFLVTGFLFPLILPPTLPLWQAAIGIVFATVLGKEVFGGTGMNILNPALVARAFLFFAYPAQMSGNVWVAARHADVATGATALARWAEGSSPGVDWMTAFLGRIPGSMGETSALACLLGAVLLLVTRVASWRTMVGVTAGTFVMSALLNAVGSGTNPMFSMPFHWHIVLGGWAFGTVFMATDPVSSAFTERGKWIYGFMIGVLVVLVRVVNPAYPEGMMLAILFMNMLAPLIDYFVVQANIKRRMARYGI